MRNEAPWWLDDTQSRIPLYNFGGNLSARRVDGIDKEIEKYFGIDECKEDCRNNPDNDTTEKIESCYEDCKAIGGGDSGSGSGNLDLTHVDTSIIPIADDTYDFGTDVKSFKNGYYSGDVKANNFITTGSEEGSSGGIGGVEVTKFYVDENNQLQLEQTNNNNFTIDFPDTLTDYLPLSAGVDNTLDGDLYSNYGAFFENDVKANNFITTGSDEGSGGGVTGGIEVTKFYVDENSQLQLEQTNNNNFTIDFPNIDLSDYVTNDDLGEYATNSDITTALDDYLPLIAGEDNALEGDLYSNHGGFFEENVSANNFITTGSGDGSSGGGGGASGVQVEQFYVDENSQLQLIQTNNNNFTIDFPNLNLDGYVTNTDLSNTLNGYVTNADLSTTLEDYITDADLSSYITDSDLTTALEDYLPLDAGEDHPLRGKLYGIDASFNSNISANNFITTGSGDGSGGGGTGGSIKVDYFYIEEGTTRLWLKQSNNENFHVDLPTGGSGGTTYSAGDGLDLTGTTFSHKDTSNQTSVSNTGRTYIQEIQLDTYGHITSIKSATETVDNTTYSAGDGLDLNGTTFSHKDTSNQASVSNGARTYIKDITLDTYGHITSISSGTETVVDTHVGLVDNLNSTDSNKALSAKQGKALDDKKVEKVTSTDNAIPKFNGTNGDIQNTDVIIDDNDNVNANNFITTGSGDGSSILAGVQVEHFYLDNNNNIQLEQTNNNNFTLELPNSMGSSVSGFSLTGGVLTLTQTNGDDYEVTIPNNDTTYSAGNGLSLNGTVFSHKDTSSQSSVNNSARTYIQDITLDTYGHITSIKSATETVVNTDTTYSAGNGLSLNGTVFSHKDTSSQGSVNNSARTYIQDITLDTYGHITSIKSATETVVDTHVGLVDSLTSTDTTKALTANQGRLLNNKKVEKVTSTDNAIPKFNGTGGAIQNTDVIIDDNDNVNANNFITTGSGDGEGVLAGVQVEHFYLDGNNNIQLEQTNNNNFTLALPNSMGSSVSGFSISGHKITLTQTNGNNYDVTVPDNNTTYSAGNGLSLNGTVFSHKDTSSQGSVNNSARTYIQDITLDTYGHITSIKSATETVVNTDTKYSAGNGLNLSGTTFSHKDTSSQASISNPARSYIQSITLDTYGHITAMSSGSERAISDSTTSTSSTTAASSNAVKLVKDWVGNTATAHKVKVTNSASNANYQLVFNSGNSLYIPNNKLTINPSSGLLKSVIVQGANIRIEKDNEINTYANSTNLYFNYSSGKHVIVGHSGNVQTFKVYGTGEFTSNLDVDGNLRLTTPSNYNGLYVNGDGGRLRRYQSGTILQIMKFNGTDYSLMASDGKVGINQGSDTRYNLAVNGNGIFQQELYLRKGIEAQDAKAGMYFSVGTNGSGRRWKWTQAGEIFIKGNYAEITHVLQVTREYYASSQVLVKVRLGSHGEINTVQVYAGNHLGEVSTGAEWALIRTSGTDADGHTLKLMVRNNHSDWYYLKYNIISTGRNGDATFTPKDIFTNSQTLPTHTDISLSSNNNLLDLYAVDAVRKAWVEKSGGFISNADVSKYSFKTKFGSGFYSTAGNIGDDLFVKGSGNVMRHAFRSNGMAGIGGGTVSGHTLAVHGKGIFDGDVTVGATSTGPRKLNILASDSQYAELNVMGGNQGSGRVYVGQSGSYGGGFFYDGDSNPDWVGTGDRVTFFRRSGGTDTEVFGYGYGSSRVTFKDKVYATNFITTG